MATTRITFKRDSQGLGQVLKSAGVKSTVHSIAEVTARNVRAAKPDAEEVVVDDYTTDRAASSVTIKDTRGRLWQVRDGVLSRAAASAGLEVTLRR